MSADFVLLLSKQTNNYFRNFEMQLIKLHYTNRIIFLCEVIEIREIFPLQ